MFCKRCLWRWQYQFIILVAGIPAHYAIKGNKRIYFLKFYGIVLQLVALFDVFLHDLRYIRHLQQLSHICIKLEILITDTCIRIRNEITSFLKTVNQQWRTNCKNLHVEVANIDASCRENSSHDPVAVFTKYIRSYEKCYDLSVLNRKIKL